mmetsp:Transcript_92102/g.199112  ORF Transcript_92102/g.199112 Transcript_92102/m.199112 type:complete len:95 (+) Transcript_92102:449-733(+)
MQTGVENSDLIKKGSFQLVMSILPFAVMTFFCVQDVRDSMGHDAIFWPTVFSVVATLVLFICYLVWCIMYVAQPSIEENEKIQNFIIHSLRNDA